MSEACRNGDHYEANGPMPPVLPYNPNGFTFPPLTPQILEPVGDPPRIEVGKIDPPGAPSQRPGDERPEIDDPDEE